MSSTALIAMPPKPAAGIRWVTRAGEGERDTGMSFGLLALEGGEAFSSRSSSERAVLLLDGDLELRWEGRSVRGRRDSLFDERPFALHVAAGVHLELAAHRASEVAWIETANADDFPARHFEAESLLEEERRGEGRVDEASFRLVRTLFDERNRPRANLVLGEVVNLPGRWSSWPPHHHPQPEIYHYRFDRPRGYGHAELGDQVLRVVHGDTLLITGGVDHAQVAAPGYAMWYLWAIRHLPGNRYTVPEFTDAHRWTMADGASSWRPKGSA